MAIGSEKDDCRDLGFSFCRRGDADEGYWEPSSSVIASGEGISRELISATVNASCGKADRSRDGDEEEPRLAREDEASRFLWLRERGSNYKTLLAASVNERSRTYTPTLESSQNPITARAISRVPAKQPL